MRGKSATDRRNAAVPSRPARTAITRSVVVPRQVDSAMLRAVAHADGAAKQGDPNGRVTISAWIVEAVRRRLTQERPRRTARPRSRRRVRR